MFGNFNNCKIINNNSGNVTINGRTLNIPNGSNIVINNGKLTVNGKDVDFNGSSENSIVNIEIT